ncbi:MAG: hypothetical protein JWN75_986 [Candidatus Saccharibacteria bacterium]|nr:hypothetical protein [Candidatus Saccharibacteria bacterium]
MIHVPQMPKPEPNPTPSVQKGPVNAGPPKPKPNSTPIRINSPPKPEPNPTPPRKFDRTNNG